MITYKALKLLGADNFVIDGDPSTEAEFLQQVEFVSGKDENHNAIYERDVTKWPVGTFYLQKLIGGLYLTKQ